MEVMGAAYRSLSCAAARQLLHLPQGGPGVPLRGPGRPEGPGDSRGSGESRGQEEPGLLGDSSERELAAILKACADRGSGCAARALANLQMAEQATLQMLVFRS